MTNGFSVLEVIIGLTLSLMIFSIVITSIFESSTYTKKITTNQQVLESIFHTVDTIKSDLSKCGMRLQEAGKCFDLSLFETSDNGFKLSYGISSGILEKNSYRGDNSIKINSSEYFKKRKKLLIYNPETEVYEFNEIKDVNGKFITLSNNLKNDYFEHSNVVVLKYIEYKLYSKQKILKRKIDRGYFQPLIENVSDFFISFFPESNSTLYRIEVNKKEQIRGYIFLQNMVQK